MNDLIKQIKDDRPISMQWMYTKWKIDLDVAFRMSHANNLEEFRTVAEKLHAPGLNVRMVMLRIILHGSHLASCINTEIL